jgi:hypothetical protein
MQTVPKILWINWFQGWDVAPALVQACLASWISLNPTWEVRALTNETLSAYIDVEAEFPGIRGKWVPPQSFSNLLRLALLERYGGVWADATVWCAQPLDSWLPEVTPDGFFAFANPGTDRMISTWFLAARPEHPAILQWRETCNDYWIGRNAWDQYFWTHAMFARAYGHGGALAATWDATPKRSALPPHRLQPVMNLEATEESRRWLAGSDQPVYKLDHRVVPQPGESSTLYRAILDFEHVASAATQGLRSHPEDRAGTPADSPAPGLIVILGMHRSGTSALVEVLTTLGATLGPQELLLPRHESNERGHFEDARVVALNDWILERHGASWLNPWPMREATPTSEELTRVRECWNEMRADGVTVVKDPRLCLTLPWWEPIWAEGGPISYVHMVRHPTQVAHSLQVRDDMPVVLGELLWHEYVGTAHAAMGTRDHLVIRHADLLQSPERVSALLREKLALSLVTDGHRQVTTIDPSLQHQRSTTDASMPMVRSLWSDIVSGVAPSGGTASGIGMDGMSAAVGLTTEWMRRRQADIDMLRAQSEREISRAQLEREHDLADADRATWQAEMDLMTGSKSWRWTAPLRAIRSGRSRV